MKPHYIAREPALAVPFVALAVNIMLLLFVGAQLHSAGSRINLTLDRDARTPTAQITLSESGDASLNGSAMSSLQDLEFHLSALASNGSAISIETPPNVPSARLTELLQAANRSGFTDVALKVRRTTAEAPRSAN